MQKIIFYFSTDKAFLDIYSIRKVHTRKGNILKGNLTALVAPTLDTNLSQVARKWK